MVLYVVPIMYGIDMPGGDYETVDMSMADPAICKQLCCKNSWCKGWTMANPNVKIRYFELV